MGARLTYARCVGQTLTEEQLYDRLMQEFPMWLKEAKAKGILR
ncbi:MULTISPECIES: VWA domain-containing protein [Pseudomonas]